MGRAPCAPLARTKTHLRVVHAVLFRGGYVAQVHDQGARPGMQWRWYSNKDLVVRLADRKKYSVALRTLGGAPQATLVMRHSGNVNALEIGCTTSREHD